MELETALARSVEIETICWRIYDHLHHCFLEDREAANLFAHMRDDEGKHAEVLRRNLDYIRTLPEAYLQVDDDVRITLETVVNQLQRILQGIDDCPPTVDEAIRMGMKIEREVEEAYERVVTDLLNAKGKLALETIALEVITLLENPEHEAALYTLARTRGIIASPSIPQ